MLGDVARVLAIEVFMFEDAVDDLFSIGLFGNWDDMQEEFVRMTEGRSKELKNGIKTELSTIKEAIDKKIETGDFQNSVFSNEVFTNYIIELKQHLCLNDFLFLQKTYLKISNLANYSNLSDINKRSHEEAKALIQKTIEMLNKEDLWNNIAWERFG